MNIAEYIATTTATPVIINGKNLTEDARRDFEEHVFENVWNQFVVCLPKWENQPDDTYNAIDVWFDGTEILCRSEGLADTIADILDNISGEPSAHIGYYDPDEDERDGETDDHTGWWYVDYD